MAFKFGYDKEDMKSVKQVAFKSRLLDILSQGYLVTSCYITVILFLIGIYAKYNHSGWIMLGVAIFGVFIICYGITLGFFLRKKELFLSVIKYDIVMNLEISQKDKILMIVFLLAGWGLMAYCVYTKELPLEVWFTALVLPFLGVASSYWSSVIKFSDSVMSFNEFYRNKVCANTLREGWKTVLFLDEDIVYGRIIGFMLENGIGKRNFFANIPLSIFEYEAKAEEMKFHLTPTTEVYLSFNNIDMALMYLKPVDASKNEIKTSARLQ